MPVAPEYREAYPRAGDVAVLCEGDLIGYEAGLLRRWFDRFVGPSPLVDIWPCGTSTAIFGVCDAVGRSRPLVVIEDRDFRTREDAEKDCEKLLKDRKKRVPMLLGWRTWRRNEIENYFIEPDFLIPLMADVFERAEDDIREGLSEVVSAMGLYQATQDILYRARKPWGDPRFATNLVEGVDAWPNWDEQSRGIAPRTTRDVRTRLENSLGQAPTSLEKDRRKWDRLQLLERFDERLARWSKVELSDLVWRTDWAGKEVLQLLRMWITGRFGWRDPASGIRQLLRWEALKKADRDEQDRPVEAALRPILVSEFLSYLEGLKTGEIAEEFEGIRALVQTGKPA